MLGARRVVAVMLMAPLVVTFAVAVAACRADATLLDDGYLRDRLHDADLYARAHDELTREWVDGYVGDPDALPERLQAMGLPADLDARARMVELVQALAPVDLLERTGDQSLGVIPWMTGKTDGFEVTIELHDGLEATFGHAPGEPSLFQEAWLDFEMGDRMVTGFINRATERPEADAPSQDVGARGEPRDEDPAPPLTTEERAVLDALLAERLPDAAAWWDEQLFAVIDDLLPYLTGESDELDITISFETFPELALAFSDMLGEDAAVLRSEGWRFTDDDLADRLQESGDTTMADVDRALAIFRPGGTTFDQDDFLERMQSERAKQRERGENVGADIMEVRQQVSNVRLALRWGTVVGAALLIAAIAFLGGTRWASRVGWGAAALLAASGLTYVVTSILMAVLLRSRLDEWVEEQDTTREGGVGEVFRVRAAEVARTAADDIVGGMQTRALLWAAVAMIALGLAIVWPRPAFRDFIRRVRGTPPPELPAT